MSQAVERHYTVDNLLEKIRAALVAMGRDLDALSPEDLAPVDEIHTRGRAATLELAAKMGIGPDSLVLDIGSGLGGPSRLLAATYGCRVQGVDLTAAYCETAEALAQWVGLSGLVSYRKADALDLPFEDATFDAAITQHVAMNIADKAALYAEARRVLKPGAAFAIYDVLKGECGAPHYPVPWAREASISFLATPEEMRHSLTAAGFEIESETDTSPEALEFFDAVAERLREKGPPPLGIHLLMGDDFRAMAGNLHRNIAENRVVLLEFVCRAA